MFGGVLLFSDYIDTKKIYQRFFIALFVVISFMPQVVTSYNKWNNYKLSKEFDRNGICLIRKEIIELEAKGFSETDIEKIALQRSEKHSLQKREKFSGKRKTLQELKPYTVNFSGYPNLSVPVKIMMNRNAGKMFHCGLSR